MRKESLRNQLEKLLPFDSQTKIDLLVQLMTERNSSLDCYLDKWICHMISNPSLISYFKDKSINLKRLAPTTDTMPFLSDLLIKYYPVDNITKVDLIFNELNDNGYLISKRDHSFASGKMRDNKLKQRWDTLYKEARDIKLQVEFINYQNIVSVPQPLATLLVSGAVDNIQFENYYKLREGDIVYVYASDYSSEMMVKLKYNISIWSKFSNGIFSGSYNDNDFPENCYIGKFVIGKKLSKGVEEIKKPEVFNRPLETGTRFVSSMPSLSSHSFRMKHVELKGRTIVVPVNDETWEEIHESKGDTYFYWEEGYDKIVRYRSIDEIGDDIWDDDEYNEIIEGFAGDEKGLYDILFTNGNNQRKYRQSNVHAIRRESYETKAGDFFLALLFDFEKIVPVEDTVSSFDILQKKDWILDWNCVRFKNGVIIVSQPIDGSVKFKPKAFPLSGSMESFNYLKEYLNNRLAPVHCSVENMELSIYDTIRLNEAIQKFATASKQRGIKVTNSNQANGITVPQQVSFNQALSKAKQMTPEEFEKYKSEYIDFLVSKQSKKYKVIPCVERLAHADNDTTEYAFLFSIKCKSGDILIVHENVHPDRSTLLFVVKEKVYDSVIRTIYDFLQSAEINKRSSLRGGNIDIKESGVEHYRSINHDYFYSWSSIIKNYISFYKNGHVFMIY